MDSDFQSVTMLGTLMRRAKPNASAHPKQSFGGANGYRLSSHELISGLDVRLISLATLPAELISELVRLHRTWDGSVGDADPRVVN